MGVTAKQLKVLHIIESLAPAGAEQVLVNTVPEVDTLGFHSEVAALWPPYDLAAELETKGVAVHRLDLAKPWDVWHGISALRRLIARNRYDLIHAHLPMAVFYCALAKGRIPSVATFHGLSFEFYPARGPVRRARRIAERWWTNRRVDACIAVSASVADHYAQVLHIPRQRIEVIPNGFPLSHLSHNPRSNASAIREEYGIREGEFFLVNVGRFVSQKGHIHLLEAVRFLVNRGFPCRLLLIGKGPLRPRAERFVMDEGLEARVKFLDPISHEGLMKILQAADLFVFPSVSEGFGMAAGEAMCLGLPVVASDLPGIASLIENGVSGVLVPPGDSNALADAIVRLFNDPTVRSSVAREARHRIENEFSINSIARRITEVYVRLLRDRVGRSWRSVGPSTTKSV